MASWRRWQRSQSGSSLTITEGGYLIDPATGEFDVDHPSIQPDLKPGAEPATAFGLVTAALALRRRRGVAPFTVMSCDNVPGNGDVARLAVVSFARLLDPDLDRGDGGLPEFDGGPQHPGHHRCRPRRSGRPDLGALAGFSYCHEVCQDPTFRAILDTFMLSEAAPTLALVPGVDLDDYRRTLIERFVNPYVREPLSRLCADTSDRIPKFLLPSVRDNLAHSGSIEVSALVLAAWARYAEGVDDDGHPIEVVDPLREQLMAAAQRQREEPAAFLAVREIFSDDLVDDTRLRQAYLRGLASLYSAWALAQRSKPGRSSQFPDHRSLGG